MVGLFAGTAQAAEKTFNIGGDIELDAVKIISNNENNDTVTHGGRAKLSAVGEVRDANWFVKGIVQPMVPFGEYDLNDDGFSDSEIDYDDVFLQFGSNAWDLQLGRFEAMNLFPAGKDPIIVHAGGVNVYEANKLRGRTADRMHGALHFKAGAANIELGTQFSKDGEEDFTGFRPAINFDVGRANIFAGLETIKGHDSNGDTNNDFQGFGLGASAKVGGGELTGRVAHGKDKLTDYKTTSFGLNFIQGAWGAAYVHSTEDRNTSSDPKVDTLYGGYTIPLFSPESGATMTFGFSTSKSKNAGANDKVTAGLLRFNYGF